MLTKWRAATSSRGSKRRSRSALRHRDVHTLADPVGRPHSVYRSQERPSLTSKLAPGRIVRKKKRGRGARRVPSRGAGGGGNALGEDDAGEPDHRDAARDHDLLGAGTKVRSTFLRSSRWCLVSLDAAAIYAGTSADSQTRCRMVQCLRVSQWYPCCVVYGVTTTSGQPCMPCSWGARACSLCVCPRVCVPV